MFFVLFLSFCAFSALIFVYLDTIYIINKGIGWENNNKYRDCNGNET